MATIDYVHGIGNSNDSAHVTIKISKIIPVPNVWSLRIESVAFFRPLYSSGDTDDRLNLEEKLCTYYR